MRKQSTTMERFDREADFDACELLSAHDRSLSADEYAARNLHRWGCFSLHLFRYRDPVLGAWVKRVGELFDNPDELEAIRDRLLTEDERATVLAEMQKEF